MTISVWKKKKCVTILRLFSVKKKKKMASLTCTISQTPSTDESVVILNPASLLDDLGAFRGDIVFVSKCGPSCYGLSSVSGVVLGVDNNGDDDAKKETNGNGTINEVRLSRGMLLSLDVQPGDEVTISLENPKQDANATDEESREAPYAGSVALKVISPQYWGGSVDPNASTAITAHFLDAYRVVDVGAIQFCKQIVKQENDDSSNYVNEPEEVQFRVLEIISSTGSSVKRGVVTNSTEISIA